jgi:hypothetical protein
MSKLKIERLGGFGGFGAAGSHLRSSGEIDMNELSASDRKVIEDLFNSSGGEGGSQKRDGFRYRITRGSQSIVADEEKVPGAVRQCVRDELI